MDPATLQSLSLEGESRGTKYVDAGCSMPIISYLAFGLIAANTLANVIQAG